MVLGVRDTENIKVVIIAIVPYLILKESIDLVLIEVLMDIDIIEEKMRIVINPHDVILLLDIEIDRNHHHRKNEKKDAQSS